MVGFSVGTADEVKRFHKKAIELGGTCEGEPNQRGLVFLHMSETQIKIKYAFLTNEEYFAKPSEEIQRIG